ncbi:MAG TPA: hypothetical protein VMV10_28265 [Pirellulales bacterium]|nr:hypothetical protein [Pirellulales bacterium]
MSWLFEDPTPLIVVGVLIEGLLAVVFVNTRQLKAAAAMAGVLVLVLAGLAVEQVVVTDYERIEAALDGTARSLRANDVPGLLAHIDPQAAGMRQNAETNLRRARIRDAKVKDLKVQFHRLTSPPTAEAEFIGNIKGSFQSGIDVGEGTIIRRFHIKFVRRGDDWLMTAYEDLGPPIGPGRLRDEE